MLQTIYNRVILQVKAISQIITIRTKQPTSVCAGTLNIHHAGWDQENVADVVKICITSDLHLHNELFSFNTRALTIPHSVQGNWTTAIII